MIVGCKKDKEPDPVPEDTVKRFITILNDSLKDRGFGYSFVVYRKNEMVGSGVGGLQARKIEVSEDKPVTVDSKMQIASMTKTLTAVSFLKLAQEKGIKTTDKISNYLPPAWTRGQNIELITFRDLLTHQSGIIGLGENCQNGAYAENHWNGLKSLIEKGVRKNNIHQGCYQNANFGLFRVLIPAILGYQFSGDDEKDNLETRTRYEQYVRENLLEKAGVVSKEVLNNGLPFPTFGYDHPYTIGQYGFDPGGFSETTGAYGFYLSATEAAKIYSFLFSTEDASVLNQAMKDSVLTAGLGSYSTLTPNGTFSYHDGWWYSDLSNGRPKGFRGIWMKCPDDLTVVMFTNALRHGDGVFPIKSDFYFDITSYVLWAFSKYKEKDRNGRVAKVNFHSYLKHPEPH
ncbi:MAG: serine hydrolase domain-containing protein [Dyadobacter sp.]|uniref:serine hydrolase domain-containing protein n=1 Tax=Dyadobacter sp. TaxID=1914288 RepID=UPI003266147C